MKLIMNLFFLLACTAFAMEQPEREDFPKDKACEIPSRVPSLRTLAFLVVKQNMRSLAWKAERRSATLLDIVHEDPDLDVFEKARRVDLFKLKDLFEPVIKEVANYIDDHRSAGERKKALAELITFSTEMQRAIQELRKR